MKRLGVVGVGILLMGCGLVTRTTPARQAEQWVLRAEALAQAGQYLDAQEAFRRALDTDGAKSPADRALFGLARLYTVSANPSRDYREAHELFGRVATDYPESTWGREARAWREVLATVLAQREELSDARREVERLRREAQQNRLEDRREAQQDRQEVQRIRQDLERLKQLELTLGPLLAQREELIDARREVERLRQEAQQDRQEVQRIRQDLERLKQLELTLQRLRRP